MPLALIIHGTPPKEEYFNLEVPSPSNFHWFPWLQKQLLMAGYLAQTPEMPVPYRPDYTPWAREVERYNISSDDILIGHSCGAGFLVRWLSENKVTPKRVVLVAPWLDPDRNHCVPGFFDFTIDKKLTERTELHLMYSDNDDLEVERSVQLLLKELPRVKAHLLPGWGHFCGMSTFEELKQIAITGVTL